MNVNDRNMFVIHHGFLLTYLFSKLRIIGLNLVASALTQQGNCSGIEAADGNRTIQTPPSGHMMMIGGGRVVAMKSAEEVQPPFRSNTELTYFWCFGTSAVPNASCGDAIVAGVSPTTKAVSAVKIRGLVGVESVSVSPQLMYYDRISSSAQCEMLLCQR